MKILEKQIRMTEIYEEYIYNLKNEVEKLKKDKIHWKTQKLEKILRN